MALNTSHEYSLLAKVSHSSHMQHFANLLFLFLYCSNSLAAAHTHATSLGTLPLLCHMATPIALAINIPQYSDVCFSSRWPRPCHATDTLHTLRTARDFHADWLLWCYSTDTTFIRQAKQTGLEVQIALWPALPDWPPFLQSTGKPDAYETVRISSLQHPG